MNSWIKIIVILIVFSIVSCGNEAPKPENPKDVFILANTSSLKVNDAKYTVNYSFKSDRETFASKLDISLKRDNSSKLKFKVRFKTDGGEGLYDGKKYYFKDDAGKKVFVSGDQIQPEMFISNNWIINAIYMIMLDEDYSEDIKNRKDELVYLADAKYGEFNTTVIQSILPVTENKVMTKITSYFDKESNLPVKEVRSQTLDKQFITQTFEISGLKLNEGIDDSEFVMTIPEGYTSEVIQPESEPESKSSGAAAPDFNLKDINGNNVSLSGLKGKVVVLDFWGTWCHWCVKAMPKLQNVHEHFKGKDVVVLGISCNERANADPKKFMADNKVTYNSVVLGDKVAAEYGVNGFPTLFVIDKEGKIITSKSGFSETLDEDLISIINKNL